ncbi:low affinity Fe/Cu permease [Phyllobacterium sp. 1468]|uniref:low affinity iron permease family protein n=1 Tax=Phyllobacterium sp. 1468 TaxID=2817759 RepID=UPI001AE951FA|nr:low affinity iron permease family protein [Phyllobacterium sp. 1468]MDR6636233.1 low affinity Fe/Cu permease [Phyllobacterium sp. 1468]
MNNWLFATAEWLSKPPGFWGVLAFMVICSILVPLGIDESVITFGLSVLAIVVTGIVLIQGFRDTAAIQAKLDEIILRLPQPNTDVVGLEKKEPEEIESKLEELEQEASAMKQAKARAANKN